MTLFPLTMPPPTPSNYLDYRLFSIDLSHTVAFVSPQLLVRSCIPLYDFLTLPSHLCCAFPKNGNVDKEDTCRYVVFLQWNTITCYSLLSISEYITLAVDWSVWWIWSDMQAVSDLLPTLDDSLRKGDCGRLAVFGGLTSSLSNHGNRFQDRKTTRARHSMRRRRCWDWYDESMFDHFPSR